jgi:predicted membrane protein
MLNKMCAPTLIYIAFSLTQIIIDTLIGFYNTALFKFIVMIIISILLNILCSSGMTIISWLIVFIPFIFMSVIVAILLYTFGLNPTTGRLNINSENKKGNLIYSRNVEMTTIKNNNLNANNLNANNSNANYKMIPNYSTDPQQI